MCKTSYAIKQLYYIINSVLKHERNNSGLRNFILLTKPVKISQLAPVKGTYLIFQTWLIDICSSITAILPPQKTFKFFSLDSRWTQYSLIFTELVLWDFPLAVPVNLLCLVKVQKKKTRAVIWPQRQAGHPREFKAYDNSSQWGRIGKV